jgi:hypothetical protein
MHFAGNKDAVERFTGVSSSPPRDSTSIDDSGSAAADNTRYSLVFFVEPAHPGIVIVPTMEQKQKQKQKQKQEQAPLPPQEQHLQQQNSSIVTCSIPQQQIIILYQIYYKVNINLYKIIFVL